MAEEEAARAQDPAGDGVGEEVFFVSLSYKGAIYPVPVQAEDPIATIFDFVQEALDFPRENCKLISRGKVLRPDHDNKTIGEAGLQAGTKLMLVATSAQDVSFVQSSRPDPLVKGFVEEERDDIARRKRARAAGASAWGTKQDAEYKFNSIKAEFKYSEPPPYEAEKLLQKLATDPGIIDLMKSRKFVVGILTEMSPAEAADRMAKKGTPNVDLLGYNMNSGDMIVLKLRTDNTKGFRPYHDLINTLIHEMTHNVWGPHDHNFWKLYGELKAQYMRFHRFWSHDGKAADGSSAGQFQGFAGGGGEEEGGAGSSSGGGGFGQVLGGAVHADDDSSPRSRRVLAAAARAAMGEGPGQEPKPNFLAGNGSWVFVCPCGQVHDPAGCEVAQAQERAAEEENGPEKAEVEAATAGDSERAEEAAGAAATREAAALQQTSAAATGSGESAASVKQDDSAAQVQAEAEVIGTAPMSREPTALAQASDAEAPAGQSATATAVVAAPQASWQAGPGEAAVPDLDLTELSELGLDGAPLWIARFSQRLQAIRRPTGDSSSAAVDLLSRLVHNVVENPREPKFRRIRADNPKIKAALLGAGEEMEALLGMLGFESSVEDSGSKVFALRDATFDAARLRLGKELLEAESVR